MKGHYTKHYRAWKEEHTSKDYNYDHRHCWSTYKVKQTTNQIPLFIVQLDGPPIHQLFKIFKNTSNVEKQSCTIYYSKIIKT
jgi:hypothetical protein